MIAMILNDGLCPPPVPGHTPRTRFACARPFHFTKGAGLRCASVLDDVDFYGAGGFVEGGIEGGGDLF